MKISSKGEYGIRALLYLALDDGEAPVPSRVIAAEQEIPNAYLRQILAQLSRDGLVSSTRGPRGGHRLALDPTKISLFDILRSLEGETTPVDGALSRPSSSAEAAGIHVLREIFLDIKSSVDDILTATTLDHLVRRHGELVDGGDAAVAAGASSIE